MSGNYTIIFKSRCVKVSCGLSGVHVTHIVRVLSPAFARREAILVGNLAIFYHFVIKMLNLVYTFYTLMCMMFYS